MSRPDFCLSCWGRRGWPERVMDPVDCTDYPLRCILGVLTPGSRGSLKVVAMSTWLRILGVLVLGFLMCVGNSGTANAHSDLSWSYPEEGASVPAPPAQVVLRMSSPVSEGLRKVEVRDGSGRPQEITRIHTARDGSVVVSLDGTGARGTWNVDYRLVAADGHSITGEIQFAVGEEMLKARQAPEGSGTIRWLSIAGGTTALLAAVVLLQRTGSRTSRRQGAE